MNDIIVKLWEFGLFLLEEIKIVFDFLFNAPNPETQLGAWLIENGYNSPMYLLLSAGFIILIITTKIILGIIK